MLLNPPAHPTCSPTAALPVPACCAAVLFGQLIHHSLVSSVSLGIALRYVLEALRTGGAGHRALSV